MQSSKYFSRLIRLGAFFILTASLLNYPAIAGGGDVYQIYLNNKLLMKEIVSRPTSTSIKEVQLSDADANDQLVIFYFHCGTPGTNRHIVLKDGNDKVYKEWSFADNTPDKAMAIPVKEILDYKKSSGTFSLYYSADQLQGKERMLTALNLGAKAVAKPQDKAALDVPFWTGGIFALSMLGLILLRK